VTALAPIPKRRGVQGHLHLLCAADERGRSYVREQSFSVPFHLSKPFHDSGTLVLNVVNPTAGLLRGDSLRSHVEVAAGARLLLTSPSATRVHDTQDGGAESLQHLIVRAQGWLEVLPELLIPQGGARFRQRTSIEIEASGELIFLEMLAPGRVASGEIFQYEQLDWRTEIRLGGALIAREKFVLSPHDESLRALRKFSAHPYVATFFIITPRLERTSPCWTEINSLQSEGLWLGCSQLVAGGWVIKMIAESSDRLRQTVSFIREKVFAAAQWPLPCSRKL
jgi:urease accessory protein